MKSVFYIVRQLCQSCLGRTNNLTDDRTFCSQTTRIQVMR